MKRRFMTRDILTLTAAVCGSAVLFAAVGCEDADARQRDVVQQQIIDATAQFQHAALGALSPDDDLDHPRRQQYDDELRKKRSELQRIAGSMSAIREGEPGQQAAALLLAASAHRELAMIELRGIYRLEAEHHQDRRLAESILHSIRSLASIHAAREAMTTQQHRAALNQSRQVSQQQLQLVRDELSRVRQPISDITQRNERDRAQVDELRDQATALMRRADELGPADGRATFEEAIGIHRQADLIEFRLAQRELELTLEHQPAEALAAGQQQSIEALIQSLQSAIRDLESMDELYASDAARLDERISGQRNTLRQQVQQLSTSLKGEGKLYEAYEKATEHLEQALSLARRASGQLRGDTTGAASIAEARAHESLGRLHWNRAGGLADHLALLAAIVDAGNAVGDVQPFRADIEQFTQQHSSLREKAKESLNSAKDSLGGIGGAAAQQAGVARANIEMLLAALDGRDVDLQPPAAPAPVPDRTEPAAPSGDGFATADELIEFLRTLDELRPADINRLVNAIHADTRLGEAFKDMMRNMLGGVAELSQAVEDQFGRQAAAEFAASMAEDMPGGGGVGSDFDVAERSSDRVVLRSQAMAGMPEETLVLLNVNGQWMIDAASMADDDAQDVPPEMEQFTIGMLEQMGQMMGTAMNQLAQRVRGGEFSSVDELMDAMMQMMMQGAGGMGMPGQ
jgi:hypothetical protein